MSKKFIVPLLLLFCILNAVPLPAQAEQKKNPPFLINNQLPHMTRQIMDQWDNPELNLTDEQKRKLMRIRQITMAGAKDLARKIIPMEQQVVTGIFTGKKPEELAETVRQIAQLRTEATMIHLRCIADTLAVLNDRQEKTLKTLYGNP
jgi:Spy/CpxP family protein refolding chaperone